MVARDAASGVASGKQDDLMATTPTPDPTGGAPEGGAPPSAPSQAPAPPELIALSRVVMVLKQLAQQNPVLSAGLTKAVQGINEAQSAMVSQPAPQPTGANPPM